MYQVLENKFYDDKYLIKTRSQSKSSGIKLLEIHGVRKNLDPNLKPEIQHTLPIQGLHQKERNLMPSIMQLAKHPT